MKDLTIIVTILVAVFIGNNYTQNLLKNDSGELAGQLEMLKEDINANEKNFEEQKDRANKIYENWVKKSENWSVLIDHQEIDLIEKAILGVKSGIETNETSKAIQKIEESIFLVNHIPEKEKLNVKNIF